MVEPILMDSPSRKGPRAPGEIPRESVSNFTSKAKTNAVYRFGVKI
jgi:hypothetical protein